MRKKKKKKKKNKSNTNARVIIFNTTSPLDGKIFSFIFFIYIFLFVNCTYIDYGCIKYIQVDFIFTLN